MATRNTIASKLFCRADDVKAVVAALAAGTEPAQIEAAQSRVFGEAETAVFAFSNGETRAVGYDGFNEAISRGLLLYGIAQKLGDAYALSQKQVDDAAAAGLSKVEAAVEAFDAMLEQLLEGNWATESVAGPRTSMVLEAWERAARAQGASDARIAELRPGIESALKSGRTVTKPDGSTVEEDAKTVKASILGNKKVNAAYEALKLEAAKARADKAAAAAAEADDDDDDSILG